MSLAGPVRYWASRAPLRPAISMDDRDVTWAELDRRTSRLAQSLRALGVAEGDRVAALVPNSIEFCETVIACFKLGAVFVPLNFRLAPLELAEILEHCGAETLVTTRAMLDPLLTRDDPAAGRIRRVLLAEALDGEHLFDDLVEAGSEEDPKADLELPPEHPAFLCYTSGTTGKPKGAVLSHRNVLAVCAERMTIDAWNHTDRAYVPYALGFTGGLVGVFMPMYVAGGAMVLDSECDAERTLQVFEERRITQFIAVGSILESITQAPSFATADLSSLRQVGTGGQAIAMSMLQAFAGRGIFVCQGYGLTEGGPVALALPGEWAEKKVGSAGLPTPQTEVRVVDPAGEDVPPGETGELLLRGPQVMERYWRDDAATEAAMGDGWLRTGDLVRQDEDGFVFVVDRIKNMLITGGVNVYPAEIERVLSGYPGLVELVVIAVPDEKWGEVPALVARVDPAATEQPTAEAIIEFCRERLARYKAPKYVRFITAPLPRSMANKVLRQDVVAESLVELGLNA